MVSRVRAYVTGASGFVGGWLTAHLAASGDEIIRVDREIDVTDPDVIARSVAESAPDVVYHLAGLAHVGRSWSEPAATFRVNALGEPQRAGGGCPLRHRPDGHPRQLGRGVRPGSGNRTVVGVRRAPPPQPVRSQQGGCGVRGPSGMPGGGECRSSGYGPSTTPARVSPPTSSCQAWPDGSSKQSLPAAEPSG